MSRSGQRTTRALAALFIAAAPVATAGCSAGFSAASQQVKPDVPGAAIGDLRVQNVAVVVAQDPTTNLATGPAELVGAIVNTGSGDDTLESVTIGAQSAKITPGGATPPAASAEGRTSVALPAGQLVSFAAADSPDVTVPDGSGLKLGAFVPVTFTFANAGSVIVNALAEPNTGVYSSITPVAATATPTATSTGTSTATATPTGTSTPTGSTSPSATPTH